MSDYAKTADIQALQAALAGGVPISLGQKTMAASSAVVIASDQSAIPVTPGGLAGSIKQTVTAVGATAVPVPTTALTNRSSILVQAPADNTLNIYLGASTVTADEAATGGIKLLPGQSIPLNLAAGVVLYARSTSTGQHVVTLEAA